MSRGCVRCWAIVMTRSHDVQVVSRRPGSHPPGRRSDERGSDFPDSLPRDVLFFASELKMFSVLSVSDESQARRYIGF